MEMCKRWFRLSETIIFMVGGGPQRPQEPSQKRFEKQTRKNSEKHNKIRKSLPKGTPWGGQQAANEPTFSSLFRRDPFGGALWGPGSPKHPQGHKNDTKNDTVAGRPKASGYMTIIMHIAVFCHKLLMLNPYAFDLQKR